MLICLLFSFCFYFANSFPFLRLFKTTKPEVCTIFSYPLGFKILELHVIVFSLKVFSVKLQDIELPNIKSVTIEKSLVLADNKLQNFWKDSAYYLEETVPKSKPV